jgi:DNA-3-methyladenine glycosylase
MIEELQQAFFNRSPLLVGPELLGKILVHEWESHTLSGRITEVEAYLSEKDEASHSYRGQTKRNALMFKEAGHAYIYKIHQQRCFNIVTQEVGIASAVLIRALEPLEGIEQMKALRGRSNLTELTTGPGKLTQALAITLEQDGIDVTSNNSSIYVLDDGYTIDEIVSVPRVGITKATKHLWRFYIKNNQYISKK